jgi:hypothetical protein
VCVCVFFLSGKNASEEHIVSKLTPIYRKYNSNKFSVAISAYFYSVNLVTVNSNIYYCELHMPIEKDNSGPFCSHGIVCSMV